MSRSARMESDDSYDSEIDDPDPLLVISNAVTSFGRFITGYRTTPPKPRPPPEPAPQKNSIPIRSSLKSANSLRGPRSPTDLSDSTSASNDDTRTRAPRKARFEDELELVPRTRERTNGLLNGSSGHREISQTSAELMTEAGKALLRKSAKLPSEPIVPVKVVPNKEPEDEDDSDEEMEQIAAALSALEGRPVPAKRKPSPTEARVAIPHKSPKPLKVVTPEEEPLDPIARSESAPVVGSPTVTITEHGHAPSFGNTAPPRDLLRTRTLSRAAKAAVVAVDASVAPTPPPEKKEKKEKKPIPLADVEPIFARASSPATSLLSQRSFDLDNLLAEAEDLANGSSEEEAHAKTFTEDEVMDMFTLPRKKASTTNGSAKPAGSSSPTPSMAGLMGAVKASRMFKNSSARSSISEEGAAKVSAQAKDVSVFAELGQKLSERTEQMDAVGVKSEAMQNSSKEFVGLKRASTAKDEADRWLALFQMDRIKYFNKMNEEKEKKRFF